MKHWFLFFLVLCSSARIVAGASTLKATITNASSRILELKEKHAAKLLQWIEDPPQTLNPGDSKTFSLSTLDERTFLIEGGFKYQDKTYPTSFFSGSFKAAMSQAAWDAAVTIPESYFATAVDDSNNNNDDAYSGAFSFGQLDYNPDCVIPPNNSCSSCTPYIVSLSIVCVLLFISMSGLGGIAALLGWRNRHMYIRNAAEPKLLLEEETEDEGEYFTRMQMQEGNSTFTDTPFESIQENDDGAGVLQDYNSDIDEDKDMDDGGT